LAFTNLDKKRQKKLNKKQKNKKNWKTKIKMFFQEINFHIEFNSEIVGIIVIAGSLTVGFILIISKLLNAW
jgi:uncharacterized membrane protein (DUF485 family)